MECSSKNAMDLLSSCSHCRIVRILCHRHYRNQFHRLNTKLSIPPARIATARASFAIACAPARTKYAVWTVALQLGNRSNYTCYIYTMVQHKTHSRPIHCLPQGESVNQNSASPKTKTSPHYHNQHTLRRPLINEPQTSRDDFQTRPTAPPS